MTTNDTFEEYLESTGRTEWWKEQYEEYRPWLKEAERNSTSYALFLAKKEAVQLLTDAYGPYLQRIFTWIEESIRHVRRR